MFNFYLPKTQEELEEALYEAKNNDSIDIRGYSLSDKELMWSFARKFDTLDKEMLKNFLGK